MDEVKKSLYGVLQMIRHHNRPRLRKIAQELKQADGERWAVGEMLERACIVLDAIEMLKSNYA